MFETYSEILNEWLYWLREEKDMNYPLFVTPNEFLDIFDENFENLIMEE